MSIVGPLPETGIRVVLERPQRGGPPWSYTGEVVTPDEHYPLTAVVDEGGAVSVGVPPGAPTDLATKVRLMVRAVARHGGEPSIAPPRRIARWRPDR